MGWKNPPVPWSEIERTLSGRRPPEGDLAALDSPARSVKRHTYRGEPITPIDGPYVPYAELHAHSHYSFLDGASAPERLVEEAVRLRLNAIALTDHDGMYGVVRLAEAAEIHTMVKTVFGAELSLRLGKPQNGEADPEGTHLLVLARGEEGYHRLAGAITDAQLHPDAEKGRPLYDLHVLAEQAGGRWTVLTGCRKGAVRQALAGGADAAGSMPDIGAASRALDELVDLFGADHVVVELFDTGSPLDTVHNDALFALAKRKGLASVATGLVHYASKAERPLATAMAAVRARRSLDELDGWLPAASTTGLRTGAEMAKRFARYPGVIERSVEIADSHAFSLRSAKPKLPKQDVPDGHTPMTYLRRLVDEGIAERYPPDYAHASAEAVRARMEKELSVIEAKDFPGYFLIVHDIVRFARDKGILCQGRGSAANSAVCYALGITAIDSIEYNLPFERFLSSLRPEEPDIDVDFDARRREEVIQHVFDKYGRRNAAQVANVISYRPKNAVRDMAKALGHSTGQQDAWSKQVERYGPDVFTGDHDIPDAVVALSKQLLTAPRHLGIHSGGMVLTDRPVGEVVPIERARMAKRTVLQWDKGDCEWMGLVKFDLLGLGMLAALQYMFDMIGQHLGEAWTLASIPKEESAVYDMLCRADAIGVFQVESRAQLGTLPRLLPRAFYDLVIEVALIRPGPIQGGAVHPYIRRRAHKETVTYAHEDLKPVLKRTLGIPLFQEQVMQMAMAVGDCSAADADLLRRAMGSKRGVEKIESLREKVFAGMARRGLDDEQANGIWAQIEAFADFGFAESHALSFALLVYASAWLKLHYPAAFLAALIKAQPMGFYSAQSLTQDAVRHGVIARHVDINRSGVHPDLEPVDERVGRATDGTIVGAAPTEDAVVTAGGMASCLDRKQPPIPQKFDRADPDASASHRRDGALAVRLGLAGVNTIGEKHAQRIVDERDARGPYSSMDDLARRVGLTTPQLEALSAAGAFESLGLTRRQSLWAAGPASRERRDYLPSTAVFVQPPLLPMLTESEQVVYDLWATGVSPGDHPMRHVRQAMTTRGIRSIADLQRVETGTRVEVAGVVTHRQRPATASGITFMNIEDEGGMLNVICSVGVWGRYRRIARESAALVVRGILERSEEGVLNLVADRFESLVLKARTVSRDFQ
ncbi:error-prone DNA polymerase [Humibacter ginsenosidimutans]|uniref:Error-prone DNA polymerase n=1 Tax=Humibacter ginsenosidimutans TaxID=2599293 RepID=A0A5B8M134_9MICO|nr:error-prone DNA polymerase [Humibacter ginsenosidimutans]QDZ13731.1 error-prone DNA polymerase [Humibacter ginsenosidimutans]